MRNVNTVSLFLLLIQLGLAACSDNPLPETKSTTQAPLGELVSRKTGSVTSFVTQEGLAIDIKVLSVEDSRCPSDVVCVWEGMVSVKFQIGERKALYNLCLAASTTCSNELTFFFEGKKYTLALIAVSPYPTTTNTDEEKVVEFELRD